MTSSTIPARTSVKSFRISTGIPTRRLQSWQRIHFMLYFPSRVPG
ncbi:hypothetical protein [Arthrobacter nitrophenolicus]|uniref:Uncharacterized protein n=1 Tax=Arthrobacter nitrophenolicus TaxID=683150 RepID=A0ACC6THH1_9MICC|nr:hypothetical protein [Arthrobacter nitrophenolicus]